MKTMKVRLALLVCSMALAASMLVACGDNTPTAAAPAATTASANTATAQPAATTTAASQTTAAAGVSPLATATPPAATTAAPTTNVPATTAAATTAAPTTAAATTSAPTTAPATTQAPATTTAPATTAANGQTVPVSGNPADVNKDLFIDDRSNALQIIRSFYNAINRKEYVRAYSYWTTGSTKVPAYAQFEQGYKDTAAVQIYTGQLTLGAGAGNRYYGVPFSLKSTSNSGAVQVFAGCYTVHQGDPANYGAPPFQPMSLDAANVQPVQGSATAADIMAKSCQDTSAQSFTATTIPADDSAVGANYFLDDRSTPEAVIRSFYNAINRKEYVRAYSYFKDMGTSATSQPPAYAQFEQGYKDTASVTLTTGTVTGDAGAGQLTYQVPVKLVVKHTDGSTENFSGTYTLRKSQPANFGAPPFIPMGIASATIQKS